MAPKPKIPPEYAKVAQKLSSETPNIAGEFSRFLDEQAAALSDNLESRSVNSVEAINSAKPAGVFAKTEGTKTPDVKSPADFEVSMDELLQKHKEPKVIDGSGAMKVKGVIDDNDFVHDYDKKSGVLMDPSGYTPESNTQDPSNIPLNNRGGLTRTRNVIDENMLINENKINRELANPDEPRLFANKQEGTGDNRSYSSVENIPVAAGGAIGAGVLLSSQNAEAKTNYDEPTLDTSYTDAPNPRKGLKSNTVTENGNTSTVMDELQNITTALKTRAKKNLTSFANDVGNAYTQYHAEKEALAVRAQEMVNRMESHGQVLTDEEKQLIQAELGVKAGSPLVSAVSDVEGILADTSKFNKEVLQPIKAVIRAGVHIVSDGTRRLEQQYAPSIAVLHDTVAYPLLGSTGWNIKPDSIGITDSEEDMEAGMSQLNPEVRKLFDDKTALLGTDAGKAMFVFANKFADLPLWILGGSSKAALMLGGAANEIASDDKEANPAKGALIGLGAGKIIEHVIAPAAKGVASKGINLLGKSGLLDNLSPGGVMDVFGKVTYDDNVTHVKKVWQALVNKNTVEPLLMTTAKGANLMADNAALKVRPDVSEAMNTKVIAPQALVLSIEPATGKPIVYGVKDGLYGQLDEHVNPEGRPVLINQIAKQEWMDNEELRNTWNKLIDPKRKTPNTTKHAIDDWTPDVIPPENPALVFAWKQFTDTGKAGPELYRAGSRDFNKDFLKARVPVRVEFTHPDGRADTGIGFWGAGGDVIFAPDASENIPGAIPKDLIFKKTRLNPNVPAASVKPQDQAWEINHLTDEQIYTLVDDMKARNDLERGAAEEAARGGLMSDGTLSPDKRPPAPFDNLPDQPGSVIPSKGSGNNEVNFSFIPIKLQDMAKAVQKMSHSANNAAGKLGLISDTVYGEKFKIDASIQAFSLRHYKRLTDDLKKQLIDSFKDAARTPLERQQFNDQLRYYIENHSVNNPAPLPPQLNTTIQQKVQKYVAERNYEYALIKQLGGTVPDNTPTGNAELEKMFALEYFDTKDGEVNPWLQRIRKQQHVPDALINLLGNKDATRATKNMGHYDQVMGRMSAETEMAKDYMNRKLQLSQLAFMNELANNTQASSPIANQMLGHTKQVDFNAGGMLKGKWVSEETYKAIYTYPRDQKMLQNTMLGIVNMIKFNKTVLNPTTWVKNIMGNVWGVMNSNIVSSWNMVPKMYSGVKIMRSDLKAFNLDVMANDPAVHRIHEALKFGLVGAEFESSRTKMLDVLDNLAEPIAKTANRTWGENVANLYFKAKDNTLGSLAHLYSSVDMATKYSLYVNGLERWGVDLSTNKIHYLNGRARAADLLGASVANNFAITDDTLTEMVKREIVRRIHLSLPMVDRIGPIATALNKASPITNPWLRTASELTRITLQMPHRMLTEKGYAVNALKTASFLGTILGVNKALRLNEGISDEVVDDAKRIAPKNITNYMPGATATRFYAGEGKDRGVVFLDFANGLVEPAQWFKGGEVNNGVDAAKRIGANGIDLVFGGGLLSDESKDIQAALGLIDTPQNYGVPFWKQGDAVRFATQKFIDAGPQIANNAWQLYSTANMPPSKGVDDLDIPRQPMSMVALKTLGIPVASMGSEKQREYKIAELESRIDELENKRDSADYQTEGSPTGPFQKPYNAKDVEGKYDAEIARLEAELKALEDTKAVESKSKKINLLNKTNMRTPHL